MKNILFLFIGILLFTSCEKSDSDKEDEIDKKAWYQKLKQTCKETDICKTRIVKALYKEEQTVYFSQVYGELCEPLFIAIVRNIDGEIIKQYTFSNYSEFENEITNQTVIYDCVGGSNKNTPSILHEGHLFGAGEEGFTDEHLVIKNTNDWKTFLTKLNSINNESDHFSETEIDFSNYIIICLFDEVRPTSGYAISIKQIKENNTQSEIIFSRSYPNSGLAVLQVITQPYCVAKIPKTSKAIVFKEE